MAVEEIRDGKMVTGVTTGKALVEDLFKPFDAETTYGRRDRLSEEDDRVIGSTRCLSCNNYCENYAEVYSNRANISLVIPGAEKH